MGTQVLANKNDLPGHASVDEVIKALALSTITNREVSCYSISGKSSRLLKRTAIHGRKLNRICPSQPNLLEISISRLLGTLLGPSQQDDIILIHLHRLMKRA